MISLDAKLSDLVSGVDLLLVDVWGVLHNGVAAYAAAHEALTRYRAQGGFVMLVSNAARSSDVVVDVLNKLGVPHDAYDGVVTSGDMTRSFLSRGQHKTLAYFGPEHNRWLYAGLKVRETPIADAELALCAGLANDESESPADYADRLRECRARGLTMLCANPDIVVERGSQLVWCAGAIAEAYQKIGGAVIWAGKPQRPIYDAAIEIASLSRGRKIAPERMMVIGDAIRTDIAGAHGLGVRSLMTADGIHAKDLLNGARIVDEEKARLFLATATHQPSALTTRLVW